MGSKISNKGKSIKGKFIAIPAVVYNHDDFKSLSTRALKLLIDLLIQYNGHNNGDLCAAMSLMKKRGWKSNDQRNKALKELIDKEIITLTRQGGKKIASLYAVTWHSIDECKGKLDILSTTKAYRDFTKNKFTEPHGGLKLTNMDHMAV